MSKILVSACLLGHKVRYDGNDQDQAHSRLKKWVEDDRVVTICPEVSGGLGIPRPPAEIQAGKTGDDILSGHAVINTNQGDDVTANFIDGANKSLALAKAHNVRVAILKARSPSCGSGIIYDGTFSGTRIPGMGVTAALLSRNGVFVFDEDHIDEALNLAQELLSEQR